MSRIMATAHGPRSFAHLAELALLLLLATLWGASYTFIKLGVESIPPVTLIAARTTIAAVVLLGVLRWRGIAMPTDLALWRRFLFQACLNSVIPFTLIAWAEQSVDAGLATILNSSAPIFTFVLAWCLAREQSTTRRQLFGVICGMIGICLIVGVQAFSGIGQQLAAELAIVAATICYAGAAIFGRNFKGLDPMLPATGSLLCGAFVLVPISLVIDHPWALAPSSRSIVALTCLAVLSTALAFTIYFRLIRTLGSVGTTAQAYLRVPIGVAIGVVFLGETLASTTLIGLVCVIAGVAAMAVPSRRR
jgi:drug/metabolite transporter (DMT)-like permease